MEKLNAKITISVVAMLYPVSKLIPVRSIIISAIYILLSSAIIHLALSQANLHWKLFEYILPSGKKIIFKWQTLN